MSTRMTVYQGTDVLTTETGDKLPQRTPINAALNGVNTVVPAVVGSKIRVLQYVLLAASAVTATWESSGGTVLGLLPITGNGLAPPFNPVGHFETLVGEGLVLYLSGAIQCGGHVQYVLV